VDPTTSIPIHLTLETVVLAAAGLILAWATLRRNWPAVASALVLVVVQSLHAGQFIEREDDPLLLVLRLAGVIGLALSVLPLDIDRALFGAGLAAVAGGALWDAAAGGSTVDVTLGPHLLRVAGAAALLVWVWLATRPSVRLRVLAAFVSVLAVAVVVAGGAVARVAAVNSRDDQYARLAADAATVRRSVIDMRDALRRRASTLSPFLSIAVANRRVELDPLRFIPGEWATVLDRDGAELASVETQGSSIPYARARLAALDVVRTARSATLASLIEGSGVGLNLVAAAPVFRPGGTTVAADVIGVVLVGRWRTASELRTIAADPEADVAIVDDGRVATTDPKLAVSPVTLPKDAMALRTLDTGKGRWLAAVTALPDGEAQAILASPLAIVVSAARDLVRAFLVAILAAALLAVIAALWLSSRITRPMLDLADDAERLKTDFLASVSHELRTPLTPIRGYADLLRRGRVPAGDQSEYLDEIGQAAQRLERIVALLLDVASIEAGRFRIDVDEIASDELLHDAGKRWQGRSRRHKIQVNASASLPSVMVDREAIARVLDELLDNAIKFSPGGAVELRATEAGDRVEFAVRDEGPGMDAERVEALREAFSQAETGDTRRFGGLGLGLAFAEGVLAAHGARLEIATAPDQGTTCSFTLPAASSVTRMSSARGQASRTPRSRTASRKR
jgi:signal transduction histidine kinase